MKAVRVYAAKDLRIEDVIVDPPVAGQVQVKMAAGGICGSDLHYFNHGGFGSIRLKEPMILGHEVAGYISALGDGVEGFTVGDLVSISPSRPCYECEYCEEAKYTQCMNMKFYGSAMPFPHIQGAFQSVLNCDARQCVLANGLTPAEAAMAEPFTVALHSARRAGDLLGKRVLVTGCGPIGVLSIIAARRAGAAEIVATDLVDEALEYARLAGADITINMATHSEELDVYSAGKGYFHALFECSGAAPALRSGISALRPYAVILQTGLGGDMPLPMMQITAKELEIRGCFRGHEEFQMAVELMRRGLVDVKPLISHSINMEQTEEAMMIAMDRKQSMKTQITFS